MSNDSVNIFTTCVMGILTDSARQKLFNVAKEQNTNSGGAISEVVYSPDSEDYILRKSQTPVGLIGMGMYGKNMYSNNIGAIVVGQSSRLDRIELIALRTALLYSFCHDDITVYVEQATAIHMYAKTLTSDESTMVFHDGNAGTRDVREECTDIINLRGASGKKTTIKVINPHEFSGTVRTLRSDTIAMHDGNTDFVVHDRYTSRCSGGTERLKESIQQAGVSATVCVV